MSGSPKQIPPREAVVKEADVVRLRKALQAKADACEAATHVLHLVGGHRKAVNDLLVASKLYHVIGNNIGVDLLDEVPF